MLIFVYGSLMRGMQAELTRTYQSASFICDDKVNGELYDLGWYPGVKPVKSLLYDESLPSIHGEVYCIDTSIMSALDCYEGHPDLFKRSMTKTEAGLSVWIYYYNKDIQGRPLVESGDWYQHTHEREECAAF